MNDIAEIALKSTEDLRRELADHLELTVASLARMAGIVRELERRGVDLSDLRTGLVSYLRLIGQGRLSAKAVAKFVDRPLLLRAVAELPLDRQDQLADGQTIDVLVSTPGGHTSSDSVAAADMSLDQIRLAFCRGQILSPQQQLARLSSKVRRRVAGHVKIDRNGGGLMIGRKFFPADEIRSALLKLNDVSAIRDDEQSKTFTLRLTPAEHTRLKTLAATCRLNINETVRLALAAFNVCDQRLPSDEERTGL